MKFLVRIVWGWAIGLWIYSLFAPKGLPHLLKSKITEKAIRAEIAALQAEIKELEAEILRIRTDPLYLEYLARSQLGMIRQGEILFIFGKEARTEEHLP